MKHFDKELATLKNKIAAGDLELAHEFAKKMHSTYHGYPMKHFTVHAELIKITRMKGEYVRMIGHCLGGYIFAVPASLTQKYLGLVLPAFRAENSAPHND